MKLLKKLWNMILELFSGKQKEEKAAIIWEYGGFSAGSAVEDPETVIGNCRIGKTVMSYRWEKGDLSKWGIKDPHDASKALACAFFWSEANKAWIGGKFDWISSDRLSRNLENIDSGYKGWDAKRFWAAPRRAFCIVKSDGKKRTNLVEG
jgi:hypothetical protein